MPSRQFRCGNKVSCVYSDDNEEYIIIKYISRENENYYDIKLNERIFSHVSEKELKFESDGEWIWKPLFDGDDTVGVSLE